MKYILDFDDTIFDTEKFKKILRKAGIGEHERGEDTFTRLEEHTGMPFEELVTKEKLVHEDALHFISEHAGDCVILSSAASKRDEHNVDEKAQMLFQELKIRHTGIAELVGDANVRVVAESKLETLQELQKQFGECVFVDDKKEHIEEAESIGMPALRMVRGMGHAYSPEHAPARMEGMVKDFNDLEAYAAEKKWA